MTVSPANQNTNFQGSFYDKILKNLPDKEIKHHNAYTKLGSSLASPHWNRLTIGAAAITTQPAMDYFNPRVDKDTATASALRTLAKIIVCTTVGFIVRGSCYKLANKFVHANSKKGSTLFTPNIILNEKNPQKQESMLKLHRNTLSTLFALSVMLFTNFFLDAPGATVLANKFIENYYARQDKKRGAA